MYRSALFLICLVSFLYADSSSFIARNLGLVPIQTAEDISVCFPQNVEAIVAYQERIEKQFQQCLHLLLQDLSPTFEHFVRLYDLSFGSTLYTSEMLQAIAMLHPDQAMRQKAGDASLQIQLLTEEALIQHPEIYQKIKQIPEKGLSKKDRYFLRNLKTSMQNKGLGLPKKAQQKILSLHKELASLEKTFSQNILSARPKLYVTKEELSGMEEAFFHHLEKAEDGRYILTTDYPILFPVLRLCTNPSVRKQLYQAMSMRGYPENLSVLKDLALKRKHYAEELGFPSYAHLQLSEEMVQSPERAKQFLEDLRDPLEKKQREEFAVLIQNIPEGVILENQRIQPWDLPFTMNAVQEKLLGIDHEKIKEYFPLDYTIASLMRIYQKFFSLTIEEIEAPFLWSDELHLMKIQNKTQVLGYILLDLHPRPGKYTHACELTIQPALKTEENSMPGLSIVVCNFPKDHLGTSLMRYSDVVTFFHEFGHAIHALLGKTDLLMTSGTMTQRDFVELPSQLLERWLLDQEILELCSCHYETKQPIPAHFLKQIKQLEKLFSGISLMRQMGLAQYSLDLHLQTSEDPKQLWDRLMETYRSILVPMPLDYFFLSFGHLDEYAACYYGYLWSKVFALDVFETIQQKGLLNPEIGKRYEEKILKPGGSEDPNQMLKGFLGREPSQKAFFRQMGLECLVP